MAYCTTTQVQGEFKNITFSASTSVTDTEVSAIISEVDAEIDGRLGVKYVTPITGTNALLICRTISIYLVAARVSKIQEIKTGEADKDQPRRVEEKLAALQMIKDIIDGKILLSDAIARSSYNGVRGYTYENSVESLIDVESEQW